MKPEASNILSRWCRSYYYEIIISWWHIIIIIILQMENRILVLLFFLMWVRGHGALCSHLVRYFYNLPRLCCMKEWNFNFQYCLAWITNNTKLTITESTRKYFIYIIMSERQTSHSQCFFKIWNDEEFLIERNIRMFCRYIFFFFYSIFMDEIRRSFWS